MQNQSQQQNLSDLVNIQPFLELGITKPQSENILASIFALLQGLIDDEIQTNISAEDEQLIKETFDEGDHIRIALAYDEIYKEKTGKSLNDFSKQKLDELIEKTARFLAEQKNLSHKVFELDDNQAKEFIELVESGRLDEAEAMIRV